MPPRQPWEFLSRVLSNRSASHICLRATRIAAADAFRNCPRPCTSVAKGISAWGKRAKAWVDMATQKAWCSAVRSVRGMLKEDKQQRGLIKAAKRCGEALKKGRAMTAGMKTEEMSDSEIKTKDEAVASSSLAAAAGSVLDDIMVLGEENQQIASALGIDGPCFVCPKCSRRLTVKGVGAAEAVEDELCSGPSLKSRASYLSSVALKTQVSVRGSGSVDSAVGGGRSLHASRKFKQGQVVLSDTPLLSISFDINGHCDHCGHKV